MARHGTAYRALLPSTPPLDYALLVTLRLMPSEGDDRPPVARLGAARTAPGYLPHWRAGSRRRRGRSC